jgi:aminobenzoyl-glutamate transport protein
MVEKRLGAYDPAEGENPVEGGAGPGGAGTAAAAEVDVTSESRGLRFAGYAVLASLVVVVLLSAFPGAPLRNPETGSLINDAPLMESLIVIITLIFLAAGIGYGYGARSLTGSTAVINAITKTWASLAGLLFMLFLIAQFIAYFNYSNMPTVISVAMADVLEQANIGPVWLLIGFVVVIAILDIIIPGLLPKWAIFAPVFIPLFIRLGVAPQTLLAAYRVGDSPMNVITPLMVYLPFIVLVAQRYKKTAGLGTIVAMMIPFSVVVLIVWLVFFIAWFVLGIPMGPGYPASL